MYQSNIIANFWQTPHTLEINLALAAICTTLIIILLYQLISSTKSTLTTQEDTKKDGAPPIQPVHSGLSKTRNFLLQGLGKIFSGQKALSEAQLEAVHEALYRCDIGAKTVDKLVSRLQAKGGEQDLDSIKTELRQMMSDILEQRQSPLAKPETEGPWVFLIVGVNGAGKTTSIAKLANYFLSQDLSVMLAAGDTYRAAAIEQLQTWGERLGVKTVAQQHGSDPAAVAFDAIQSATTKGTDVLIIDTAGRLQNKKDLMDELAKMKKVLKRHCPTAPHETLLVLDATTGQNAFSQVSIFKECVELTGLIVSKLDGTAKGGVVVGLADQVDIPVRFIGVGEKMEDLRPFEAAAFAQSLLPEEG